VRDGRGMGTPSPLCENRNPAPGKHNKPGEDWRVVAIANCSILRHGKGEDSSVRMLPSITI